MYEQGEKGSSAHLPAICSWIRSRTTSFNQPECSSLFFPCETCETGPGWYKNLLNSTVLQFINVIFFSVVTSWDRFLDTFSSQALKWRMNEKNNIWISIKFMNVFNYKMLLPHIYRHLLHVMFFCPLLTNHPKQAPGPNYKDRLVLMYCTIENHLSSHIKRETQNILLNSSKCLD